MSQNILHRLFCLVRYICKQSECRNIDKNIIIKSSGITGKYFPIYCIVCRLQ